MMWWGANSGDPSLLPSLLLGDVGLMVYGLSRVMSFKSYFRLFCSGKKEMSYPFVEYGTGQGEKGSSGQKLKIDGQRQIDILTKHKLMNRFIYRQTKRQIETQINRCTDRHTD